MSRLALKQRLRRLEKDREALRVRLWMDFAGDDEEAVAELGGPGGRRLYRQQGENREDFEARIMAEYPDGGQGSYMVFISHPEQLKDCP